MALFCLPVDVVVGICRCRCRCDCGCRCRCTQDAGVDLVAGVGVDAGG